MLSVKRIGKRNAKNIGEPNSGFKFEKTKIGLQISYVEFRNTSIWESGNTCLQSKMTPAFDGLITIFERNSLLSETAFTKIL